MLEIMEQKSAVINVGQLVFKNEPRWVFAGKFQKIDEFLVYHDKNRIP